jgi:hypothetical protein
MGRRMRFLIPKRLDRASPRVGSPSALVSMSASTPRLSELPTEILEHVILYLPGQDIIRMEVVRDDLVDPVRYGSDPVACL